MWSDKTEIALNRFILEKKIFDQLDRKLAEARNKRKARRKEARKLLTCSTCQGCEAPEGPGLDSHINILFQGGLKIPAISN